MMESVAAANTALLAQLTNEKDGKLELLALSSTSRASANGASLSTLRVILIFNGWAVRSHLAILWQYISSLSKEHSHSDNYSLHVWLLALST
jgi:hypothetical protein